MKKLIFTAALFLSAMPSFAAEVIVKEVTDASGKHYFSPDKLTVQPGDKVTFENSQDGQHEVMFVNVPKQVDDLIASPILNKKGDKFSYTFTVPGTYQFHCHLHAAAGMKGTLIVGQASELEETKNVDLGKLVKKMEESSNTKVPPAGSVPQGKDTTGGAPSGSGY